MMMVGRIHGRWGRRFRGIATMVDVAVHADAKVAVVTLNRPKQMNALCDQLVAELNAHLIALDKESNVKAIVISGSGRAFAAGADIKEMSTRKTFAEVSSIRLFSDWSTVSRIRKPIVAAVNGFALGGGCELAMMCDIIIAGDTAQFGLPEVLLGTIPGCGGTQRLVRAIGKSKAMEMILAGSRLNAEDAERCGLVSRVVPVDQVLETAVEVATKVASFSGPAVCLAKQAVNASFETALQAGIDYERALFYSSWSLQDRRLGMEAFVAKEPVAVKDC